MDVDQQEQHQQNGGAVGPAAVSKQSLGGGAGLGFDTDLYSRQLGAFGAETMVKLIKMRILVKGLRALGVETAKNIILAGPKSVTLLDDDLVEERDMSSNFYATPADVTGRRTRSECCCDKLAELNPYVSVQKIKGPLTPQILGNFDVVICTETPLREMISINTFCRTHRPNPIGFICGGVLGLAVYTFVDFGLDFAIHDKDGEEVKSAIVAGITYETPATVHIHNDKPCPFQDGDWVAFREVQGMTDINGHPSMRIRVTGRHAFILEDVDVTKFSPYTREGVVQQVKVPFHKNFMSLAEAIETPVPPGEDSLIVADFAKLGRSEQLHFGIQALLAYQDAHGTFPDPLDPSALRSCLELAEMANKKSAEANENEKDKNKKKSSRISVDKVEAEVLMKLATFADCQVSPMTAMLGGVIAQEAVKFTGKYTPLYQWLYMDFFEALNPGGTTEAPPKRFPSSGRYADQVAIWGPEVQRRLGDLKVFLVGAGALGCEVLKNFALMGIGCGPAGRITVTDMDSIEISNLNRQFLFRREHVGKPKSEVAAEAVLQMNPAARVIPSQVRVGVDTESVFDDKFWDSLDLVVNALDNVPSRLYVDSRCVWYGKPLMESGTLGTKANVQVILPFKTQSYGDSQDPPEESIPLCTLRHFPNQIEHTIEWGRDAFQGLFCDAPQDLLTFMKDPDGYLQRLGGEGTPALQKEKLERIVVLLRVMAHGGASFEKCVERSIRLFEEYFDHQIQQLLFNFPENHLTNEGTPFWSGPKRPPHPLTFSCEDPTHVGFIMAAANLFAFNLGLPQVRDPSVIARIAAQVPLRSFVARKVAIKVDEGDSTVEGSGDDSSIRDALAKESKKLLPEAVAKRGHHVAPVDFEKDDDSNFHVDFISTCANLRARNYKIPECDRFKCKMIAGKIIPAIATTTAMVTGLVAIEAIKVLDYKERPLEDFKNSFVNLALPLWLFSEPMPSLKTVDKDFDPVACGPIQARPNGFTPWEKVDLVIPNATLQDLLDALKERFSVEAPILAVGNACLYNQYLGQRHAVRLTRKIEDLAKELLKETLVPSRNYVVIEASCNDINDGADVVIPTIKLTFKQ